MADDTDTPHQIFWKNKLVELCAEAAALAPTPAELALETMDYDVLLDKVHARVRKLRHALLIGDENRLPYSSKIMTSLRKLVALNEQSERVCIEMRYAIRYEKGLTPEKKEEDHRGCHTDA